MRPEENFALNGSELLSWFGQRLSQVLAQVNAPLKELEEIRLRVRQPLLLRFGQNEIFLGGDGRATQPEKAYHVTRQDLSDSLERLTQSSLYAAEEDIKQGFLTLPGGHRVGITGEAVLKQGTVQTLKHISGLNFRMAREIRGLGLDILPLLVSPGGRFYHTLILSIPRAGKTTLLRALIKCLSNGVPQLGLPGQTVGVVDERGELAGMWQGVPAYDLGYRTDVLDGCPKAAGMAMLVRSMAPQIIATDELGHVQDVAAVAEVLRSGVSVLSTAHAASLTEALIRPSLNSLLSVGVFERIVVLSRRNGPGTVEDIVDLGTGRSLLSLL
ncbi:MAG: stage III sporulation protein AA [Desulfitobacteriaceae bacterium]